MEFFELFDMPINLLVDLKSIQRKYFALCKQYHPDKFSLQGADAQEEALEMTSKINQAKKVLSSAEQRLAYILREKEILITDEKYQLKPAFLGEMMEINEQLMELEFDEDAEKKAALKQEVSKLEEGIFKEISTYFESATADWSEEDLAKLKDYHYKKKYLERIKEKL